MNYLKFNSKFKEVTLPVLIYSILILFTTCADPLVKPPFVIVKSVEDIIPIDGKWVKPVVYFNQFNFDELPIDIKKKKFIEMLLPAVLQVKHNLEVDRTKVGDIIWQLENKQSVQGEDSLFLADYLDKFNASDAKDLYHRLATHPTSITLAQAAVESGWGSSRFFTEANNLFGIWSYNTDENRIQASETRGDQSIFVRSYNNLNGSIEDYFYMLARTSAYKAFRNQRTKIKDPYKLTYFLKNYSELKYTYVSRLNLLIRKNHLMQYDSLKIDPSYYYAGEKIKVH